MDFKKFDELKQRVTAKFDGKCAICYKPASRIHSRRGGKISDANENDLTALCETCYELIHSAWMVRNV